MVRRTTINLDAELVAEARAVLETKNTTDTVHGALREVVRRERLQRLAERDWPDLTLEDLKEMRRSRMETRPWGNLDAALPGATSAVGAESGRPAGIEPDRPKRAA